MRFDSGRLCVSVSAIVCVPVCVREKNGDGRGALLPKKRSGGMCSCVYVYFVVLVCVCVDVIAANKLLPL